MKNWEKHFDEIVDLVVSEGALDKETHKIVACDVRKCEECWFQRFRNGNRDIKDFKDHCAKKREWLFEECKEEIPMSEDEEAVLKVLFNQGYRFIARDETEERGDRLYAFEELPVNISTQKGYYAWFRQSRHSMCEQMNCFKKMFCFLKTEQPLEIKDLLDKATVRKNQTVENSKEN